MKIVYFAWLREQIGTNREEISLPKDIATVADLVEHLRGKSRQGMGALWGIWRLCGLRSITNTQS